MPEAMYGLHTPHESRIEPAARPERRYRRGMRRLSPL